MDDVDPAPPISRSQALPGGTCLEGLAIESLLGSGPFTNTYLTRDVELGKLFVLKEHLPEALCYRDPHSLAVAPRLSGDENAARFAWSLENFRKEAEALTSLNHAGIVRVLGGFTSFGTAYFVMPFVEGSSLEEQIQIRHSDGPEFTEDELKGLLWRMIEALNYLHDRRIFHQGIRAENILLNEEGVPSLVGFAGARRHLCQRISIGMESSGYTAPELIHDPSQGGPPCDIYALGATLFTLITGNPPAVATALPPRGDAAALPLAQRGDLRERYSERLLRSIDRALEPAPEDRYREGAAWWNVIWGNAPVEIPVKKRSAALTVFPPVSEEAARTSPEVRADTPVPARSPVAATTRIPLGPPVIVTPQLPIIPPVVTVPETPAVPSVIVEPGPPMTPPVVAVTEAPVTPPFAAPTEAPFAPPISHAPEVAPSPTAITPPIPREREDETEVFFTELLAPSSVLSGRQLAGGLVLIVSLTVAFGVFMSRETPPVTLSAPVTPPKPVATFSPPAPPISEVLPIPAPAPLIAAVTPPRAAVPAPSPVIGTVPDPLPPAPAMEGTEAGEVRSFGGIEMVWCPPGTFEMGSPWNEKGRFTDETPHQVVLTRGYWMAKTETTQAQWTRITVENPSWRKGDNLPVEGVSWDDVRLWLEKKNAQSPLPAGWKWSLPTEAQWEYGCRAGTTTAIYNGPLEILGERNAPALDPIAWYAGNSSVDFSGPGMDTSEWKDKQYPGGSAGEREVGGKQANAWGLHDMLGNAWEWSADWLGPYPIGSVIDPTGPETGEERVIRGGSWANGPELCRSAVRNGNSGEGGDGLGFRCVVVPPQE